MKFLTTMQIKVLNLDGEEVSELELNPSIFDGKINYDILHQAITIILARRRSGLASTRRRGEVRGGGRKPWRQKGTGRARVGSSRSPLWRGGGVIFGPKLRDYHKKFPKKMKLVALKSALNAKLKDRELFFVDKLFAPTHKTKKVAAILNSFFQKQSFSDTLSLKKTKILFVADALDNNFKLGIRNLKGLEIVAANTLSVYELCSFKYIFFTPGALNIVSSRIEKGLKN